MSKLGKDVDCREPSLGKRRTVTGEPVWVGRVEVHCVLPEGESDASRTHDSAGVAAVVLRAEGQKRVS